MISTDIVQECLGINLIRHLPGCETDAEGNLCIDGWPTAQKCLDDLRLLVRLGFTVLVFIKPGEIHTTNKPFMLDHLEMSKEGGAVLFVYGQYSKRIKKKWEEIFSQRTRLALTLEWVDSVILIEDPPGSGKYVPLS